MSSITVALNEKNTCIRAENGENLLEVLRREGFSIKAPCGGNGKCGKCLVRIRKGSGPWEEVCACITAVSEDCTVLLPNPDADLSWNDTELLPQQHASGGCGLGAAVDLGTTSIAVSLFDFASGEKLASSGQWNRQQSWGADVISRIEYTISNENGLSELSACVKAQITEMIASLAEGCGRSPAEVTSVFVAGNTVMEHLFAKYSPRSIAFAPFEPFSYFEDDAVFPCGEVPARLSPCISGYVGGDITAGLLAVGLDRMEGKHLFLDAGTNGEIALGGKNGFITCAVACGPAFEGAGISCGMPAEYGAIHRVSASENGISFEVLGGGEAKGICGSGLLDLVSVLIGLGIIDESGCLNCEDDADAFYLTENVFLTARDIRQLQLAKAAVAAGIRVLMHLSGSSFEDVDTLFLAGGFGSRLSPASAAKIGMLPRELLSKVRPVGNASLAGAEMALLSSQQRERLRNIRSMCSYTELSLSAEFSSRFIDEMTFSEAEEGEED